MEWSNNKTEELDRILEEFKDLKDFVIEMSIQMNKILFSIEDVLKNISDVQQSLNSTAKLLGDSVSSLLYGFYHNRNN